jgi:hypothetical protein
MGDNIFLIRLKLDRNMSPIYMYFPIEINVLTLWVVNKKTV